MPNPFLPRSGPFLAGSIHSRAGGAEGLDKAKQLQERIVAFVAVGDVRLLAAPQRRARRQHKRIRL